MKLRQLCHTIYIFQRKFHGSFIEFVHLLIFSLNISNDHPLLFQFVHISNFKQLLYGEKKLYRRLLFAYKNSFFRLYGKFLL